MVSCLIMGVTLLADWFLLLVANGSCSIEVSANYTAHVMQLCKILMGVTSLAGGYCHLIGSIC